MPEIVRAAASPFEHVGQFTVLNGAQGVTAALAEVIQQAGALAAVARQTLTPALLAAGDQNDPNRDGSKATAGPKSPRRPGFRAGRRETGPGPKQGAAPAADASPPTRRSRNWTAPLARP